MARSRKFAACVAFTALIPAGAAAQTERRTVGRDLDHLVGDAVSVWGSPFRPSARDLEGVALVTGAFTLALIADQSIHDWLRAHRESVPLRLLDPFREHSPVSLLGRTYVIASLSALVYASGAAFGNDGLRDAGLGCAASNFTAMVPRATISRLLGRARPQRNEGPYAFRFLAFDDWTYRSFTGGHASNMMSCLAYLNHRFDLGPAEPLIYAVGGAMGLARMVDDAHWASDTVLGVSWGVAAGKAVPAPRREEPERERAAPCVVPQREDLLLTTTTKSRARLIPGDH